MGFMEKVKDWLGKNPDKASQAIDKAGDFFDQRTGGKFAQQVDKAQDAANKYVNKGNPDQPPPPPAAPPQQP
jgi:hypothetical protein